MEFSPSSNYFELFGLEPGFDIDRDALAASYRELQGRVHPDRFAHASEQEQLHAVQQTAHLNEAFTALKNPLSRARYLLQLNGITIDETDTSMDPQFLMEQMELREELAAVEQTDDPLSALADIRGRLTTIREGMIAGLRDCLNSGDTGQMASSGVDRVRKMQFVDKVIQDCDDLEEKLADQF